MPSTFLCTGKTEDLIALGDTGQPVHKAALQIIAALTRKSPDLAKFLAVPKSNEQGDVIDWYSPVTGEVISWDSANDIERSDAIQKLDFFKAGITKLSQTLVDSSKKNNQSDAITFGKLLGLASFCPDDIHVSIVKSQRVNANGVGEAYNQPVLSFWGFINTEEDRKLEPLFFLSRPRPVPKIIPPSQTTLVSDKKMPWWRLYLWWLLPLLLLLLLLLLGLLRSCMPNIQIPFGTKPLPPNSIVKGSFTVWAVPPNPIEGQNYAIHILIKLPSNISTYAASDLSGTLVGTDDYHQTINDPESAANQILLFQSKSESAELIMNIPGARKGVADKLAVSSRLLNESQDIVIYFK